MILTVACTKCSAYVMHCYLFIYSVFNGTVSYYDYTALNYWMIVNNELERMQKEVATI
jgi:hypothetical protein